MDRDLLQLLDALHREGRAHDAEHADRLQRLRNLEPETGALLNLLLRTSGARSVLELGTSNGYSTIWLGEAVAANGGRLSSVELGSGAGSGRRAQPCPRRAVGGRRPPCL